MTLLDHIFHRTTQTPHFRRFDMFDTCIDEELTETEIPADLFDRIHARSRRAPTICVHAPSAKKPATRVRGMEEALHVRVAGGTATDAATKPITYEDDSGTNPRITITIAANPTGKANVRLNG